MAARDFADIHPNAEGHSPEGCRCIQLPPSEAAYQHCTTNKSDI